jgi:hypothetical protein
MDFTTFKRVLTAFADTPANLDFGKGKLICEIRDEMIEANVRSQDGDIIVSENGEDVKATPWIIRRVARLPILAERVLMAFNEPENFIAPRGSLMDHLDENPVEGKESSGEATKMTLEILGRRPAGCSSVVYLTSDAGEGKTTLITHLARLQADKFKRKETDWLLVPIALGGKPFLRFDDLVVGYLGNKLRFPLFFYEGFMELIKMGVLVPAFDGFEEMFVQSASGDALSAVGQLMQKMDSCGTVLIAARKAYFEYQDMRTQARLFDSIGQSSVVFSRVSLKRWEKSEFLSYCEKRHVANGQEIYGSVAERLRPEHPLLTRAVLVKRLLDVATEAKSLAGLLRQIGNSPNDYFSVFVRAIIEREAQEKWINRTGEPHQPLLSVQEHMELLGNVAQEMWTLSTESVKAEVLDLLTELFCETRKLSADATYQVKERTKQHALIVGADSCSRTFSFDHEEFRNFFLGDAIGRACAKANSNQKMEVLGLLRRGSLPGQAVDSAVSAIRQNKEMSREKIAAFLQEVASLDGPTSFTHENIARLLLKVLHDVEGDSMTFSKLSLTEDALRDLHLSNVIFNECSFAATSLEHTILKNCSFESCHFEQIELHATTGVTQTTLNNGDIVSIVPTSKADPVYDPALFAGILRSAGFDLPREAGRNPTNAAKDPDPNIKIFNRLLRLFQFRTHINENFILMKVGPGGENFIKAVIPKLVEAKVVTEDKTARDKPREYHLCMSMERVRAALRRASGSIEEFMDEVNRS